jgi:amino acid transporter
MGFELPTTAGDEIVKPKRTYPLAMVLVLIAAIATYAIPTVAGLYGGAGDNNKVLAWGITESVNGQGIGKDLNDAGMTDAQIAENHIDPTSANGWGFPEIAKAVGLKTGWGNGFATFMGDFMVIGAILSMLGLFIGNSVGGTRVPFALSEDGMMPKFVVHVHRKYGTPWIAIILCGVIFSIFSLNTFAFLVILDVFLNAVTLLIEFFALWKLRITRPEIPRKKIPGGWVGLFFVTLMPALIILLAIYSQIRDVGWSSIYYSAGAIIIGVILYFPIKRWVKIKNNVPDIDPWVLGEEGESVLEPASANVPIV